MSAAPFDAVSLLGQAIQDLADDLPDMVTASTDPQVLDLAAVFLTVSEQAEQLRELLRDLEATIGREMVADHAEGSGIRVDRRLGRDRKAWDHESLRRDVRRHVLRSRGALTGARLLTEDGEVLDVAPDALMAEVQHVYGSATPNVGPLRALGLSPDDYCESTPGVPRVTVQRTQPREDGAS